MADSSDFDLVEVPGFTIDKWSIRREQIYRHVGYYTMTAAGLDQDIRDLACWVAYGKVFGWAAILPLITGRTSRDKIDILRKVWPTNWVSIEPFARELEKANEYRNRLAHSRLDVDHEKIRERPGDAYRLLREHRNPTLPLTAEMMTTEDLRQRVLVDVVSQIQLPVGMKLEDGGGRDGDFDWIAEVRKGWERTVNMTVDDWEPNFKAVFGFGFDHSVTPINESEPPANT